MLQRMRFLVFVFLFVVFTGTKNAEEESKRVYLRELTIFQTHETSIPFISNPPEVYLSCEDGLDSVDLDTVKKTKQLYTFARGHQPMTMLGSGGCVTCSLKEADTFFRDQVFGTWTMCKYDFEDTGSYTVEVDDEFTALFDCPSCKLPEIIPAPTPAPVLAPTPAPVLAPILAPALAPEPSIPPEAESLFDEFYESPISPEPLPVVKIENKATTEETDLEATILDNYGIYDYDVDETISDGSSVSLFSVNSETTGNNIDLPENKMSQNSNNKFPIWGIVCIAISVLAIGAILGIVAVMRFPNIFSKFKNLGQSAYLGKVDSKIAFTVLQTRKE